MEIHFFFLFSTLSQFLNANQHIFQGKFEKKESLQNFAKKKKMGSAHFRLIVCAILYKVSGYTGNALINIHIFLEKNPLDQKGYMGLIFTGGKTKEFFFGMEKRHSNAFLCTFSSSKGVHQRRLRKNNFSP